MRAVIIGGLYIGDFGQNHQSYTPHQYFFLYGIYIYILVMTLPTYAIHDDFLFVVKLFQ